MEGTPFGRYRLIELLGRGGMGEVWRAHDTEIDSTVAITMLLPSFADDEKFEQRFRREARAAARLDDPHVVPIHDVGEIDGRLFVAMRLIQGQDLQTLLDAGPLSPGRAVAVVGQIAEALQAAHRVGLVHRDIKPSNILVAENDFAYLIDFGIARAAGEAGLTSTGATIGTWSYMAPERFTTGLAEASSHIYALACVLYQCLTGELRFPAVALEQIFAAHLSAPPPRPSSEQPTIPTAMDTVIATGMAKDPDQRYATTVELAEAARDALTVPTAGPAPTAPPHRPPHRHRCPPPHRASAARIHHPRRGHAPSPPWQPSTRRRRRAHSSPHSLAIRAWPPPPSAPPARTGVRGLGRRTTIALIAGAIALVAVIAAAVGLPALSRHGPSQSLAEQIRVARDVRTASGPLGSGTATLTFSRDRDAGVLVMNNVPPPSPGSPYEVWLLGENGPPTPAGLIFLAARSPSITHIITHIGTSTALAITAEPGSGSTQPTGAILAKIPLG
jgi:serine/threonine protein kinase, bacterial